MSSFRRIASSDSELKLTATGEVRNIPLFKFSFSGRSLLLDIFNVSDCCVTILEFMLFVNVGTPLIMFNSAADGLWKPLASD